VRRLYLWSIALVASALLLGCHYQDYRDCLYDGDLSCDTHGAVVYRNIGAAKQPAEPPLVEPGEPH
jgi:hypothetical protein